MRTSFLLGTLVLGLAWVSMPARADWNEGDPQKMHYPQLPDPNGIDVSFRSPEALADDWQCSWTGPVNDVHFWFSALNDSQFAINNVHVSIHSDIPQSPTNLYSRPGEVLWSRDFAADEVTWRLAGQGDQGWYVPENGFYNPHDHTNFYQMNIQDIVDPFVQTLGQIYWLDLSVSASTALGWKTSRSPQFNDSAVWGNLPSPSWEPVYDPRNSGFVVTPLDLAFVITPEPGSLALLGVLGLLSLRRR
jgi:hypothetical protein